MAGNTFGQLFTLTTAGESHGPALVGIIDGCPPGLALDPVVDIQPDVDRRKTGQSRFTSQRHEDDQVELLSGVFEGQTTGTPIAIMIRNQDARSKDYGEIKSVFRPGHADYTYFKKYGLRDYRGGGRSSARETVMWVAAGAIAKKVLQQFFSVSIQGYVAQIGDIVAEKIDLSQVAQNPFFFPDVAKIELLEALLTAVRRDGDSVGARVCVRATGALAGWGEPVFHKLDADLAAAMMGINAVKAVDVGQGSGVVSMAGSEHRDEMSPAGFETNHAGGILGGISTGEPIEVALSFKPTSSMMKPGATVNTENEAVSVSTKGRHDPCVGLRAVPIAEAMMALVLLDHAMRHKAQNQW